MSFMLNYPLCEQELHEGRLKSSEGGVCFDYVIKLPAILVFIQHELL